MQTKISHSQQQLRVLQEPHLLSCYHPLEWTTLFLDANTQKKENIFYLMKGKTSTKHIEVNRVHKARENECRRWRPYLSFKEHLLKVNFQERKMNGKLLISLYKNNVGICLKTRFACFLISSNSFS